jgi:putative glutamine amidotransferase
MWQRLKIGVSACFFHADAERPIFAGKTLQYVEQSIAHWVQSQGALALVIPSPDGDTRRGDVTLDHYAELLDGLVLEGGSDMWPGSYGEEPLRTEWSGDRIRDAYEIALLRAFGARGKPVLGVCRGLQVINVALGGTLYQDLALQRPGPLFHRSAQLYDRNHHQIAFEPGTRLAQLYAGLDPPTVNSVHHQGIKDLAPGLVVEARAPDGVIEACRRSDGPYLAGVQWHPEFHVGDNAHLLDGAPLLADFLAACRAAR